MGVLDRLRSVIFGDGAPVPVPILQGVVVADDDLPLHEDLALQTRREAATTGAITRHQEAKQLEALNMGLGAGLGLDGDDWQYRNLTGGRGKNQRRDLTPLQQDRMLEIVWYLWEQNAFAKRLVTLLTHLILGDGVTVEADDERVQAQIDQAWNHRINQLAERLPEFANALSVNGELILTVATNPINGIPAIGFIDPYQVKEIRTLPDNVLVSDVIVLKGIAGEGGTELKVIRENASGQLEGDVFFLGVNKLPNSLRGRSDLSTLADWLDLYDQLMFAEVEYLQLMSAYVWDYKIEGADPKVIKERLAAFPTARAGAVFAHNEKEELNARTPDLKAADRSELGKSLRTHIAGSFGFPLTYLGEQGSNRATIEGQNDVLQKTPAARQKELGGLIAQIVRFTVEQGIGKNPALFQDATSSFKVRMPEIAAKDIARVGQVIAQVTAAMDTSMANKTASRQLAVTVLAAMLRQLGVEVDPQDIIAQADQDAEDQQAMLDQVQAEMARQRKANPNPPVPGDTGGGGGAAAREGFDKLADVLRDRPVQVTVNNQPPTVHSPVTVHAGDVTVNEGDTSVHLPKPGKVVKTTEHTRTATGLLDRSTTTETPAED